MSFPYIEVNNKAVQLLQIGDFGSALPAFLVALDIFKGKIAIEVRETLVIDYSQYGYGPYASAEARALRREWAKKMKRDHNFFQSSCLKNAELSTNERLHMYSRAFLLSSREEDDPSAINRRDGTSSLLLYNIGVTLHAQALKTGNSLTYDKALTVYRLALSSAEHWSLYSGGQYSLLQMSILNNMALLHIHFFQVHECISCLRVLRSTLALTFDLVREDCKIFEWNLVLYMEGRFEESPAPAA